MFFRKDNDPKNARINAHRAFKKHVESHRLEVEPDKIFETEDWPDTIEMDENNKNSDSSSNEYQEESSQSKLNSVLENIVEQNISDILIPEDLKKSYQSESATKVFVCPVPKCAKVIFTSKIMLELHQKLCHEKIDTKVRVPCPLCKIGFLPERMYSHLKICEPRYNEVCVKGCPYCGKTFQYKYSSQKTDHRNLCSEIMERK